MFGLFNKKPPANTPLPSIAAEPERYAGRPLLIVLENYVLDCIGALQPDKQALARAWTSPCAACGHAIKNSPSSATKR